MQGIFKWSEDKIYNGQWRENCLSGFGVFKNSGKVYKGYFFDDKKHGYGVSTMLSNSSYTIGSWVDSYLEGLVIIRFPQEERPEQLMLMDKNKVAKMYTDREEIEKLMTTEDYRKLQEFYQFVSKKEL